MAIPRFFVAMPLVPEQVGEVIELPEAAAHHAVRVVRLGAGDVLTLFDGRGGEYAASLVTADKRGARARIDRFDPVQRESPLAITLVQAIVANDAMDYALRKAVELGVAAIAPVITARSAPLPPGERAARRLAHWQQIAIAACEQSGRNRIPAIALPQSLSQWSATWHGAGVVCLPEGATGWSDTARPAGPLAIVIGPEGGFTDAEVGELHQRGFAAVRMGPRVLRTETAATAALAVLQARWGDMG